MSSVSNDNGRALEYKISKSIKSSFKGSKFTKRAAKDNRRDSAHYKALGNKVKSDFSECAGIVSKWLASDILQGTCVESIDRLPDSSGVSGDPTDLKLFLSDGTEVNLSIKNIHPALKHQRLTRLPEQCGIKDSVTKEAYSKELEYIWDNFYSEAEKLVPGCKLFKEIKQEDDTFIDEKLYNPLTELVMGFLNSHSQKAPDFFKFITSSLGFYMIRNQKDSVVILNFYSIVNPSRMSSKRTRDSTISVDFDNGWEVNMRLHNASSRLYTKSGSRNESVKMDTTCPEIENYVSIKKISKKR